MSPLALNDKISFSLMKHEKQKAQAQMERWPGRWTNMSHYLRSAMIVFNRKLDQEYLDAAYQQAKLKREQQKRKPLIGGKR